MSADNPREVERLAAKTPAVVVEPAEVPRRLSRNTIALAITIALAADGLQLMMGPAGWVFADQAIDVVAALLTIWLLGFHPLLLPTFVTELIPIVDLLPTWTGCVVALIAIRRQQAS